MNRSEIFNMLRKVLLSLAALAYVGLLLCAPAVLFDSPFLMIVGLLGGGLAPRLWAGTTSDLMTAQDDFFEEEILSPIMLFTGILFLVVMGVTTTLSGAVMGQLAFGLYLVFVACMCCVWVAQT